MALASAQATTIVLLLTLDTLFLWQHALAWHFKMSGVSGISVLTTSTCKSVSVAAKEGAHSPAAGLTGKVV